MPAKSKRTTRWWKQWTNSCSWRYSPRRISWKQWQLKLGLSSSSAWSRNTYVPRCAPCCGRWSPMINYSHWSRACVRFYSWSDWLCFHSTLQFKIEYRYGGHCTQDWRRDLWATRFGVDYLFTQLQEEVLLAFSARLHWIQTRAHLLISVGEEESTSERRGDLQWEEVNSSIIAAYSTSTSSLCIALELTVCGSARIRNSSNAASTTNLLRIWWRTVRSGVL